MVYVSLMVCLLGCIKCLWYTGFIGRNDLKCILSRLYCTKYKEIDIGHSDLQKYMSPKKCWENCNIFPFRVTQKFSAMLQIMTWND